jgi:hypothetical protein
MFIFPATRYVSNCLHEQIQHIESEVKEVQAAYMEPGIEYLAEELCDVIHSAETALRILADRYGVNVLDIQALVIAKNRARGYYP